MVFPVPEVPVPDTANNILGNKFLRRPKADTQSVYIAISA